MATNPFAHLKGRKLYRSPRDAIAFGICAGIADFLRVDPVFVRIATVVLAFFANFWPVVLAYVIAAFLVPIDPSQDTVAPKQEPKDVTDEKREGNEKQEPVERMDESQNM